MMPTETLRAMLDERGVEWDEYGDGYTLLWHGGREYTVQPNVCNRLIVTNLTPEQAIAATLGPGTCKPITYDNGYSMDRLEPGEYYEFWEPACACGSCGELIPMRKFCPNCGCRLEVEA